MEFRVLGPLTVVADQSEVPIRGERQQRLLAALLAGRGTPRSAELLIEELWGPAPPNTAAGSLQVAVSKLRAVLGRDLIRTRPGGYLLDIAGDAVDAGRFEGLLAQARDAQARHDRGSAVAAYEAALELWHGVPFAGIATGNLVAAEVTRLTEIRLRALEDAAEARLAHGQHGDLVAELTTLVAEHPFRERLHASLIMALYRSGRQSDALAAYIRVRELLLDELGIDPAPELAALEQQILTQDPHLAAPTREAGPRRTFPALAAPPIGRDKDLAELAGLLEDGVRLVTVTGPGGVGKTTLMLAFARILAEAPAWSGYDIVFVDLAPLRTRDLVLVTIANHLKVQPRPEVPLAVTLAEALQHRSVLLLLDNFETVVAAAPVVADLLAGCHQLRVIITSREHLALRGEHEFALPPLELPQPGASDPQDIALSPAVQMFSACARAARRQFALEPDNAADVAEVCRRLDGLPLALELAAARIRTLPPGGVLQLVLRDPSSALSGGARDLPTRHQALENTIAWSYDLLTPARQHALGALSVGTGGMDLEAVAAVLDTSTVAAMDVVSALVDVSLLTVADNNAGGQPRVRMLETIRAFALARLEASGELDAVRSRHASHYVRVAEERRDRLDEDLTSVDVDWFDVEHDNIRGALEWALDPGALSGQLDRRVQGVRLYLALSIFWISGHLNEGRFWGDRAMRLLDGTDSPELARVHAQISAQASHAGDLALAHEYASDAVAMCRRLGRADRELTTALRLRGEIELNMDRLEDSLHTLEEALSVVESAGLDDERHKILGSLALQAGMVGDQQRSHDLDREALARATEHGDLVRARQYQHNLACTLRLIGRVEEAAEQLTALIPDYVQLRQEPNNVALAEDLAAVLAELGQHARAVQLLGAADASRERLGVRRQWWQEEDIAPAIDLTRQALQPDAWADEYKRGRSTPLTSALLAVSNDAQSAAGRSYEPTR